MPQMSPMQPYDEMRESIEDYRLQSREFLEKSQRYLADDDLHQASEKGWGAAAWMTKAVAVAQGWQYDKHEHFGEVLYQAGKLAEVATPAGRPATDPKQREIANGLHGQVSTSAGNVHPTSRHGCNRRLRQMILPPKLADENVAPAEQRRRMPIS